MSPRLLLVEDDPAIGRALTGALEAEGYDVSWARTGTDGLDLARRVEPELVLLDLGLPDLDGVEVCRTLRSQSPDTAIVMLTARRDEIDVVLGLDAGANDYVTKPFRLAELLARVRAHLRGVQIESERVVVGDLTVDTASRRAFTGEHELDLRPREFDLLALLAREAGRAIARERIMTELWDAHYFGSTKTLDVHISSLRRKLETGAGPDRPVITSLPRVGYRLDLP